MGSIRYNVQTNYRPLLPANVSTVLQATSRIKLEPRTETSLTRGTPEEKRLSKKSSESFTYKFST